MFVLDLDQDRSRSRADAVPGLLAVLQEAGVPTVLAFERTAGDEVQGLLADAGAVVDAVVLAVASGEWAVGVGVGPVQEPHPETTRAGRGPAYVDARAAVEAARRSGPGVRVVGADAATCERAGTALQLLADLVGRRSAAGHQAVEAMRHHDAQHEAARALGISPQAMSRRLAVAGWALEAPARDLAAYLLTVADATATATGATTDAATGEAE